MQKRIDKLKATMYNISIDGTQSRRNRRHLRRSVCDWCFSFFLLFIKKATEQVGRFFVNPSVLHLRSAFHRLGQRYFVGVFQIAADGQAVRDARDQNPHRLEQAGDVACRRFAFDIRIGR